MLKGKIITGGNLLGKVSVVMEVDPILITKNITANGIYTALSDNADGYSEVDVNVQPDLIEGIFTENGEYVPVNADGYSKVIVGVQPTLITKNITANGTYTAASDNADGYSEVNVDVDVSSAGVPANDNGSVDYFHPSNNQLLYVMYEKYSLNGKSWTYHGDFASPAFTTPKPSFAKDLNAACFLEEYTSKEVFWNSPNNDKCVAVGSTNINVSDFSFNGDVNAFKQAMNSKSIYLVRKSFIILTT